ncbi:hypothetical protein CAI21_08090 [Alkalilimnicola ehrlichii]|uniref:HTH araC/xylS-type domain-containing protein n=1 Tax=Alkalilimnicola ehrlichii TaxID=351052 RepID=A0A3E0WWV7_9GAMM|nr:AraC family transcriptional regulator [Alkalilimnicola ehrlichii]RFA30143.1 hypothetical protein CAI21_08090 [Alkalilimnicola ehrlichii]RFA37490.1 hypothetical protein CAL65_09435 [Alkalilimnicola ehrlichii]
MSRQRQAAVGDALYIGHGWVAYVGKVPVIDIHRHPAIAYCVGLETAFRAYDVEESIETEARTFYVPADARSPRMDARGRPMGFFFVSADSPIYYRLKQQMGSEKAIADNSALSHAVVEFLRQLYWERPWCTLAERRVEAMFGVGVREALPVDPRVARALAILSRRPEVVDSAARLAEHLGLSETRFVHLFSEETGLPFRRFRLWARLLRGGPHLRSISSLTHLAVGVGFADLAHLSRSFRTLFGLRTTAVIRLNSGLTVRLLKEQEDRKRRGR